MSCEASLDLNARSWEQRTGRDLGELAKTNEKI